MTNPQGLTANCTHIDQINACTLHTKQALQLVNLAILHTQEFSLIYYYDYYYYNYYFHFLFNQPTFLDLFQIRLGVPKGESLWISKFLHVHDVNQPKVKQWKLQHKIRSV